MPLPARSRVCGQRRDRSSSCGLQAQKPLSACSLCARRTELRRSLPFTTSRPLCHWQPDCSSRDQMREARDDRMRKLACIGVRWRRMGGKAMEVWKHDVDSRDFAIRDRKAGRRDKRGSPVEPQAIVMAWVLLCWSIGPRAAPCILSNAIKDIFGTVGVFALFGARP